MARFATGRDIQLSAVTRGHAAQVTPPATTPKAARVAPANPRRRADLVTRLVRGGRTPGAL